MVSSCKGDIREQFFLFAFCLFFDSRGVVVKTKIRSNIASVMDGLAQRIAHVRVPERPPVVYLPGNAGKIEGVENWIFEHGSELTRGGTVHVFQTLALGPAKGWAAAVAQGIVPVTPFIGPGVRDLVNKGLARNIRCNLSRIHMLYRGRWRPSVAFAHVSPPNEIGKVTLGLNAGLDIAAVKQADYKIAVINRSMPRWKIDSQYDSKTNRRFELGCAMYLAEFDEVVEIDEPLFEHAMQPKGYDGGVSEAIAKRIFSFLSADADCEGNLPHTLQLGIGTVPNAFASALAESGSSVRGVWSEMFSDGVLNLYRRGLIRELGGNRLRDHLVVGFVLGSRELYETMRENPDFAVMPQEIVNDPLMIAHNNYMASINATLAVSLSGEVAASTIGTRQHSDVGGQNDFVLGASWSQGGVAVIAVPSTVKSKDGSEQSRVVVTHDRGTHHTVSADLPVVVVTEYGVADLRELDDHERVETMLNITHPDWEASLAKEARQLPSMQGVGAVPARLVTLRSGRRAIVRPATARDIPAIKTYICALSEKDRWTRYMGRVNQSALVADDRLERLYHHTLDYEDHAAFIIETQGVIVGVAHAFREGESRAYHISFSRRSDHEREGIGKFLMHILIDWAVTSEVEEFCAVTYRKENPRMRRLFEQYGFSASFDSEEPMNVMYSARVSDLMQTRDRLVAQ